MEEVSLIIEGQIFKAKKEVLCEHSDYFQAMFSGNYKENDQEEIKIDVVDANSMTLILQYMNHAIIDLTDVSTIADLAISANFLQMGEFMKHIEYTLECQLSRSNWLATMLLGEAISSKKLEQIAVTYGMLNFKLMTVEDIPSLHKLHWYLSHPFLEINNEFEVFQFGFDWVVKESLSADALLVVLSCVDLRALSKKYLGKMVELLERFQDSLTSKIVQCLLEIVSEHIEVTSDIIQQCRQTICEKYTESVFTELENLMQSNSKRMIKLVPCIPIIRLRKKNDDLEDNIREKLPVKDQMTSFKDSGSPEEAQYMYQFDGEKGFQKWLEVAPKNLWGWSVTSWGLTKLVVVGGEYGKGSGLFMREVAVYDTLNNEWIRYGVSLPPRRHAGVAVIGNSLYIVGGVGTFRIVLCSSLIYDLEERSFKNVANLPDAIQNPGVCAHDGEIYVAGHRNIYKYDGVGTTDQWQCILNTDIRANCLVSFDNYIYATQNYFNQLYRFRPNNENSWESVANFENPVGAICNSGRRLVAFTQSVVSRETMSVEVYEEGTTKVIWSNLESDIIVHDAAGCCALVFRIPLQSHAISEYARKYLASFPSDGTSE